MDHVKRMVLVALFVDVLLDLLDNGVKIVSIPVLVSLVRMEALVNLSMATLTNVSVQLVILAPIVQQEIYVHRILA